MRWLMDLIWTVRYWWMDKRRPKVMVIRQIDFDTCWNGPRGYWAKNGEI